MDEMRQGIGLRAYGSSDPLVAYKREAHDMWDQLLENIRSTVARQLFHARLVNAQPPAPASRAAERARDGAERGAAGRIAGRHGDGDGDPHGDREEGGPQRAVPVRFRPEVQALSRTGHLSVARATGSPVATASS